MPVTRREFLQGSGTVAAVALAGMAVAPSASAQPARTWLLARDAFDNLNDTGLAGSPKVCESAFNQGRTWFSVRYADGDFQTSPIPTGYTGVGVLKFEAYRNGSTGLADAIAAGLPSWVQAVQYDPEEWTFTPEIEQGALLYNSYAQASYAQQFCETAHQHGLRVVLTPANDLCNRDPNPAYPGSAPQYPMDAHDNGQNYNAYLRHQLATSAQYLVAGDVFEYQSQQLELDSRTYHAVTLRVSQQVTNSAPSGVTFLAGLGHSMPPGDGATCAQLTAAATSVANIAAGHWLNVGAYTDQVRPMICALKSLGY